MAADESERVTGDVGLRLTYAEIASRLRISGDAARQLVRRRGWLRIVPNRRGATTTVIVPESELAGERWRDTTPADEGGTPPDGDRSELRTALTLVDRLSLQLAEAHARTDAATRRAEAAEDRANRAEGRADKAEAQGDELQVERDQARADAQSAQEAARRAEEVAEALRQAEEARKGRGRWARLRAAWRGE